jgi:hypothetical protein
MKRRFIEYLAFFLSACSVLGGTDLGISGTKFTLNAKPVFLLGISYYAGLGATAEFVKKDLDDMQRDEFNWIRVWANWGAFGTNISAVQMDGTAREPFFGRLKSLLAECDRRGMVVDITMARENGMKEPPGVPGLPEHLRAVELLVAGLKDYRNWYLDLANERNVRDKRYVSMDELKILRNRAKELDSKRLITASHSSDDEDFIRHIEPYLNTVRLDFVSLHRTRARGTAQETQNATRRFLDKMKELNRMAPIHFQEPFRRGYEDWNPETPDFMVDLAGASKGGAAGWCFHNGAQRKSAGNSPRRSFDLRERRLYDQLDDIERAVAHGVSNVLNQ